MAESTDPASLARAVVGAVTQAVRGKDDVVRLAVTIMLAEGHLLIEDVPGVGKTTLAKALADATGSTVHRIQFTPDLLPGDITGSSIYNPDQHAFEFHPGAIFANIVVADEINRASPKTQSALLESMAERHVSVDGITYALARPFLVIATQNPIDMGGTWPLPEAQRDRFMAQISLGYPSESIEAELLDTRFRSDVHVPAVTTPAVFAAACDEVGEIHLAQAVRSYIVDLVAATRSHPYLTLGASPRASVHLAAAARAAAAVDGRDFATPDDVSALALPILTHRVIGAAGADTREIIDEIVSATRVRTG